MKTYQKIIILSVILIVVAFVYLIKDKNTESPSEDQTSTTTIADTSNEVFISDSTDFYEISAIYPSEARDNNSIIAKTIEDIVKVKKEEWKTGGDLYNEDQDLRAQYPDRPSIKYELNIKYDKYESVSKSTVSYVFKSYEFTGGAHGNTALFTYTFDNKGFMYIDRFLNLSDDNSRALTAVVKEKLITTLGDLNNPSMLDSGLSDIYKNFDNFVVLDEGIKFIFGQYQVAPYAAGQPEVLVSWEELKPYVNLGY